MKKLLLLTLLLFTFTSFSQSNNNGRLDTITEFTTVKTVYATMEDGTRLATDIYLPIISDSVSTNIDFDGTTYTIQIIPKGTQLFVYDSTNNALSDNQFQLPMIFTRTPYGKGEYDQFGVYLNVLGYAYALQDMRGRYDSEGVYLPMFSDSWDKSVYSPVAPHPLDLTAVGDPKNGIYHQDGRQSIQFLTDSLTKNFDLDGDGTSETNALIYNGSLVMFGASALGNTQYQAAAAFKNNVNEDGLKGLVPIVATNELFNSVIQHNGVFRQALVQGWLTGQLIDNIAFVPFDNDIQDSIHSIFDYGNISPDSVINLAVDYITTMKDHNGYAGMYPNFAYRGYGNANYAPVNELGESDPNGQFNRYSNMELPMYHVTGWWDIFIDGQLETYSNIMANTSTTNQTKQKLIIGPWTHSTISTNQVGDLTFPESLNDLNLANREDLSGNISELVDGELIDWFRYLLNYDPNNYLGEPKVLIPESSVWQNIGDSEIRIPSRDAYITYSDFINYVGGFGSIPGIPIELNNMGIITPLVIDLPGDSTQQQPGTFPVPNPVSAPVKFDDIPNIRYYIPGPIDDGIAENINTGNYWREADEFPLKQGWRCYPMYLHADGSLDTLSPEIQETTISYAHDPENPVFTVGGGNLVVPTPTQDRTSAGPLDYTDPEFEDLTMNRPDVISFQSAVILDSISIIGIPKAKIYASSTPLIGPDGPTDTDFFIRVLDVYPNGKEYFVVEGAVNARARDYAKQLSLGVEDVNIPYSNILAGEVYAYEFNLLPIAYTFGKGHKVKILISSSNWPRYQSNPNIPIENGDFFRRTPGDNETYTFEGTVYSPRISNQAIYFSPDQPSQIIFPLFDGISDPNKITDPDIGDNDWFVYPNPGTEVYNILTTSTENYSIDLITITGEIALRTFNNNGKTILPIDQLSSGIYIIKIETESGIIYSEKLVKI